jgi:molybdopterin-guanine dinucleotide biosynthesis protein A
MLLAQASETCVSTNSTTRAKKGVSRHTSAASLASPELDLARRPSGDTLHTMTWSGLLLAGGASRRMGQDKALLRVADGRALWERQLAVLSEAGATELLVSARPEQTWVPPSITRVTDAVPGAGPLAGIAAGLACCASTHLLVLAVDLPMLPTEWLQELQHACAPGGGAVGVYAAGTAVPIFEPLAAIYPRASAAAAAAVLARSELSLQTLLRAAVAGGTMREVPILAERAKWFENWNRWDDVR